MKKNYKPNHFFQNVKTRSTAFGIIMFLFALVASERAYSQQVTYSFTTGGATGPAGPSQAQINAAYASTNLNGLVTVASGIQQFTVPSTGPYRIIAAGAAGGGNINSFGCRGRIVQGETMLTGGQVIRILVGQRGDYVTTSAGGGGGSFVASGNTPLIVGGGGGGYYTTLTGNLPSSDGVYATAGQNSGCSTGIGGTSGSGGTGSNNGWGGGGGGFNTNGTQAVNCTSTGGTAFLNGGSGGLTCNNTNGGFGGGAGTHGNSGGGGGGGGYSGGGGSNQNLSNNAGGGGGSFQMVGMTNLADLGVNTGAGYVTITKLCSISSTATANPICKGNSVTLSTDAVSGITWSDGSTSNSTIVSPTVTTTYSVVGTSSTSCIGSSAITITVDVPTVNAISSVNYFVCPSTPVTLSGSGTSSYVWSNGVSNGVSFPAPNATTVYTVTGTNSVTGCTNVNTVTVSIFPSSLTIVPSATAICSGTSASLSVTGGMTYTWSAINNLFPNITVSPTVSTTYTVNATTSNFCPASATVNISVNPKPAVTVSSNKQSICKGESAVISANGASTYAWDNAATTASITVSPSVTTVYNVTGVSAGCSGSASVAVQVNFCTGINTQNNLSQTEISVYPNPNNGEFTIRSSESIQVNLINELGEIVKSISLSDSNNHQLSLSGLSSGIYFVVGKGTNTTVNQKIIVTR